MLNQAMGADEGGKSRLANVVAALNNRIGALPPNAAVGLWTFNGVEGKSVVPIGPLSDQVDGSPLGGADRHPERPGAVRQRRGVVHHAAPGVRRSADQFP